MGLALVVIELSAITTSYLQLLNLGVAGEWVLSCSPGWPHIGAPLASASLALELEAYTITPSSVIH